LNKVAIVSSRFHPELSGGAEKLALDYALLLKEKYSVEIFTTAARDYITWENELPLGQTDWQSIKINRYPTIFPRNLKSMNQSLNRLLKLADKVKPEDEREFIKLQGPYSPILCASLLEREKEFSCIFLIGYLYFPIVELIPKLSGKVILVPTFHDEPVLHLPLYKRLYHADLHYGFNAPEEKELYIRHFQKYPRSSRIIGTYIGFPSNTVNVTKPKPKEFKLTTIGRLDLSKGYDHFFKYIELFQSQNPSINIKVTCLGANHLPSDFIPPWVESPGFVSQEKKEQVLLETDILLNPSPYESFSIATMEGWTFRKPVLVNGNSEVMRGHCLRSKGGLFYLDEKDFVPILKHLIESSTLRDQMGINGYNYVEQNFSKEVVTRKLFEFVESVINE
jgi:glycosyltransferase involved in cell wall biosynthesis